MNNYSEHIESIKSSLIDHFMVTEEKAQDVAEEVIANMQKSDPLAFMTIYFPSKRHMEEDPKSEEEMSGLPWPDVGHPDHLIAVPFAALETMVNRINRNPKIQKRTKETGNNVNQAFLISVEDVQGENEGFIESNTNEINELRKRAHSEDRGLLTKELLVEYLSEETPEDRRWRKTIEALPGAEGLFIACRVLSTMPDKLEYVIFQESEIARRNDVEVASKGFATEIEAEVEINNFGGVIPNGNPLSLDFFEEDSRTVWCWKDERTLGSSQIFESEQKAQEAWDAELLVFEALLD